MYFGTAGGVESIHSNECIFIFLYSLFIVVQGQSIGFFMLLCFDLQSNI